MQFDRIGQMNTFATDHLQTAALDPTLWPAALDALSQSTGSAGAILMPVEHRMPGLLCSPKMQDVLDGYFDGGWNLCDVRNRGVPIMMHSGVTVEHDFIADSEIDRSAFYRDFLERYGLRWFAGLGFNLGGELWCVALQRRIEQGPFLASEIGTLKTNLVALHDAATVCQNFTSARMTGMLDAIELMDRPCAILGKDARILGLSQKAEAILAGSIDVRDRKLKLRHTPSHESLNRLIAKAVTQVSRQPGDALTTILNHREEPYLVRAVRLDNWANLLFTGARVLLIFRSMREKAVDPALLKSYFGLTNAEVRMALAMKSGRSVRTAADVLGISYETARSTIKTVYSKTSTSGHGSLIALLTKFEV